MGARQWHAQKNKVANWMPGVLLLVAVVFGGGVEGIGDSVVYGTTAIAAGTLLWNKWPPGQDSSLVGMDVIIAAALGLCLVQFVPLPVMLTMSRGARAEVLGELKTVGLSPAWAAISLDLGASVRAMLAVVVFAVLWWTIRRASAGSRINTVKAAILVSVPMALLAAWQATAKADSTGGQAFFMSRNHFATLLTMLLPFAFAAANSRGKPSSPLAQAGWYAAAGMLLLGIASTFSRAGAVLAVGTLVASLIFLVWPSVGRRGRFFAGAALTVAIAAAVASTAGKLHARFAAGVVGDMRWQYDLRSWELLKGYFPWGSGVGTFRAVFQRGEAVDSLLSPVWGPGEYIFSLYAHNEPLQIGIEAGLPGLVLAAVFVTVVACAIIATLRPGARTDMWRRAAAISVPVPLLHSLVDSPLRTLACIGSLGVAVAMLFSPRAGSEARGGRVVAPRDRVP
jgi:O-antigen ligase